MPHDSACINAAVLQEQKCQKQTNTKNMSVRTHILRRLAIIEWIFDVAHDDDDDDICDDYDDYEND